MLVIILWWVLLQAVSGQNPFLSFRYGEQQVGSCLGSNYLEDRGKWSVGTSSRAETRGALAKSLRAVARTLSRNNEFYTDSLPQVRIVTVKQICASRYAYDRGNQTFAALIKYTCRGVACRQRANETRTLTYQHLFSFVCLRYTSKPGLITQLPRLSRHKIYVDRRPQNSIVTTKTAPFGSCELCRVLPPNLWHDDYDPATGCNSKMPLAKIQTSIILLGNGYV